MNTTAAIFFLVLGQADGLPSMADSGGGVAVIPAHYETLASCEDAGEAARANNLGLSFLSYTCVPAQVNVEERIAPAKHFTPASASFSAPAVVKPAQVLGPKCLDVCEVRP